MRVAIAEDSVLLREGLERLLSESGLEVVGSCETAEDLLLKVRSYSPDVAIVDIRLPPTHKDEGLRAALEIRALHPSVGVLVLSQYVEIGLAMQLLSDSAEGVGYLLKDRISDVKDFIGAIRRVASGGSAIDPIIVSTLLSKRRSNDPLVRLVLDDTGLHGSLLSTVRGPANLAAVTAERKTGDLPFRGAGFWCLGPATQERR